MATLIQVFDKTFLLKRLKRNSDHEDEKALSEKLSEALLTAGLTECKPLLQYNMKTYPRILPVILNEYLALLLVINSYNTSIN